MKNLNKNKIVSIAASGIVIVIFAITFIFFGDDNDSGVEDINIGNIDVDVEVGDVEVGDVEVGDVEVGDVEVGDIEVGDVVPNEYLTFRNEEYLNEHYEKHGIEMGFKSPEDYLDAANAVVDNQASLYKLEAEDGDGVYYLEATNEFVIVSKDGYIRTYFYPSDGIDYFNRQ